MLRVVIGPRQTRSGLAAVQVERPPRQPTMLVNFQHVPNSMNRPEPAGPRRATVMPRRPFASTTLPYSTAVPLDSFGDARPRRRSGGGDEGMFGLPVGSGAGIFMFTSGLGSSR